MEVEVLMDVVEWQEALETTGEEKQGIAWLKEKQIF